MRSILLVSMLTLPLVFGQVREAPRTPPGPRTKTVAPAELPSPAELKFPPLRPIQIPQVATYTLANGMRVYLLENHELPLVSGFALVRTGNLFDPPDKIGLADITGTVMRTGGTRTKTGDELDQILENIAASVETGIGETSGQVTFSTLRENTDEVLGIFHDVLTAPEFRQEKIDLAKVQYRSAISRRNDHAEGIASREFAALLYGKDSPYGWRMEYATIDRIQREDLIAFYRRYFFPANVMLAVYGDFSTAEMKAKLEKLFGGWNDRQPPAPPFPKVSAKPAPGVYLATKTDMDETVFAVGHLGGVLKDKNYPALEVMSDILGGGFSSRLFRRIRTELGYAYHVGADWGAEYNHPGLFRISGSTKSALVTAALKVAREEVNKIRSAEVTDQELKTAKDTVLNSFIFNFDTPGKTLSRLVRYEYHGYPKDFIFQFQQGITAVTKADVLRVAKEYVRPEDFTIVAVGNPKEFAEPLSALGLPVHAIDLTIPEPKQETAKAGPESLAEGRRLLQKAQQALGGADRLAAVKDYVQTADIQIQTAGGAMKARQTNRWVAPSHFRQDASLPFGNISTYFDGGTGWLSTPQGTTPLPPQVQQQAGDETFRVFFRLLLSDRDPERTVNAAGPGVIEISGKQGRLVRLHLDQTGMPAKQVYRSAGMGGPSEVEDIYEAWMETGGLRLPQKVTVNRGGGKFADVTIQEWKLNTGLKVEDLSKQP